MWEFEDSGNEVETDRQKDTDQEWHKEIQKQVDRIDKADRDRIKENKQRRQIREMGNEVQLQARSMARLNEQIRTTKDKAR